MLAPYRNRFRVRILHSRTQVPTGVGVVVSGLRIITRAHVVNVMLGRRQRRQGVFADNARVEIDCPIVDGVGAATLRACRAAKWSPPPVCGVSAGDVPSPVFDGQGLSTGTAAARLVDHAAVKGALVHEFGYSDDPPWRERESWTRHRLGLALGVSSDAASRHWS